MLIPYKNIIVFIGIIKYVYKPYYNDTIKFDDLDVTLHFASELYELRFNVVNSEYGKMGNEPISVSISRVSEAYETPVAKLVQIGDSIASLKFANSFSYDNYK